MRQVVAGLVLFSSRVNLWLMWGLANACIHYDESLALLRIYFMPVTVPVILYILSVLPSGFILFGFINGETKA